jgi:hypothetical protein
VAGVLVGAALEADDGERDALVHNNEALDTVILLSSFRNKPIRFELAMVSRLCYCEWFVCCPSDTLFHDSMTSFVLAMEAERPRAARANSCVDRGYDKG